MLLNNTPQQPPAPPLTPQQKDAQFLQSLQPDPLPPSRRGLSTMQKALIAGAAFVLVLLIAAVAVTISRGSKNVGNSAAAGKIEAKDLEVHADFGITYKVPKGAQRTSNGTDKDVAYTYKEGDQTAATITVQSRDPAALLNNSSPTSDDLLSYTRTVADKQATATVDWTNAKATTYPPEKKTIAGLEAVQLTVIKTASLGSTLVAKEGKQTYFILPDKSIVIVGIEGDETIGNGANLLTAYDLVLNSVSATK